MNRELPAHRIVRRIVFVAIGLLGVAVQTASASWIVFTEIHYAPLDGELGEFIEIYNPDPPSVAVGGWTLSGEVQFELPRGAVVPAGGVLVIAKEPARFRGGEGERGNVAGPFEGRLDNGGGRLLLRDAGGAVQCEVRYGKDGGWPEVLDSGRSLHLRNPLDDPSRPESWVSSRELGGTPGRYTFEAWRREPGRIVLRRGEEWRYRRGIEAPPDGWQSFNFDDSDWDAGPSGFGFADGDDATELADMEDRFLAIYTRRAFEVRDPAKLGHLLLLVNFDDGFVASLNGVEVARANLGLPGSLVTHETPAARKHEAGSAAEFDLGPAAKVLRPGRNVLAVEVHNESIGSTDVSLIVELAGYEPTPPRRPTMRPRARAVPPPPSAKPLAINEILYHPASGDTGAEFIELLATGRESTILDGIRLRGGVRFDFPAGLRLEPGSFLVVARDPEAFAGRHGLERSRVTGPFEGSLADGGEELRLVGAEGTVIDRVCYFDRAPWPADADGGGSSLERIDSRLPGDFAAAWAASDEAPRSAWKSFTLERAPSPVGSAVPELELLLLGAGECLIDDLQLQTAPTRLIERARSLLNADFENDTLALSPLGNHSGSAIEKEPARQDNSCLHVRATGRGNTRQNWVAIQLPRVPVAGQSSTLSFRGRWLRGSSRLLVRLAGGGLEQAFDLGLPQHTGTPGAVNSRQARGAPPPLVDALRQWPVAPTAAEAVTLEARIASVTPVRAAKALYRRDGQTEWQSVELHGDGKTGDLKSGDGVWTGTIPALPNGLVEFRLVAEDTSGVRGQFPAGAAERACLYAVGLQPGTRFQTYTLLATERAWDRLRAGPRLSNELLDGSLVVGDSQIFYNLGFRARGSPYTRHLQDNWKIIFGAETLDDRRSLLLDRQGGSGKPAERITYWLLESLHVPCVRQRYVHLRIPGIEDGLCEDVEEIGAQFLARAYGETRSSYALFKVDDFIEMADNRNLRLRTAAALERRSERIEALRWNFVPRGRGPEDFAPLSRLLDLFEALATEREGAMERLEVEVDVDQWLRVLAARTLMGDWDTLGRHAGKNASLYLAPDGRWKLLPWDCDQATQRYGARDEILPREHTAFVQLLAVPRVRRAYFGYIAYLARSKLNPAALEPVLEELHAHAGVVVEGIASFLGTRRLFALDQMPDGEFELESVERIKVAGKPDGLRLRGRSPVWVHRLRLGRLETVAQPVSLEEWQAVIEAPINADSVRLEALDFGGEVVAATDCPLPR